MSKTLPKIEACVFDAYGTLFDVHAPAAHCAAEIGADEKAFSALWRQKQLEYTWLRTLMNAYVPFRDITQDALDYALQAYNIDNPPLRQKLIDLYDHLQAYADAQECLQALKKHAMPTAILSNGNPEMLERAVASADIAHLLDAVISVEEVGVYKPHPRVYHAVLRHMQGKIPADVGVENICFVSSNTWDAQAAAHIGFTTIRINRFGLAHENIPGHPFCLIDSLRALPDMILSALK